MKHHLKSAETPLTQQEQQQRPPSPHQFSLMKPFQHSITNARIPRRVESDTCSSCSRAGDVILQQCWRHLLAMWHILLMQEGGEQLTYFRVRKPPTKPSTLFAAGPSEQRLCIRVGVLLHCSNDLVLALILQI